MDLYRIIRELVNERNRLQRIIDSLEGMKTFGKVQIRPQEVKRRGRKSMDHAARLEVSERMKRYWAQRRAERAQHPERVQHPERAQHSERASLVKKQDGGS